MAYSITNFNPIGGQSKRGSAAQILIYNNAAADTLTTAGYFDDAYSILSVGDIIMSVDSYGGAPADILFYLVTASASTGVTITQATLNGA